VKVSACSFHHPSLSSARTQVLYKILFVPLFPFFFPRRLATELYYRLFNGVLNFFPFTTLFSFPSSTSRSPPFTLCCGDDILFSRVFALRRNQSSFESRRSFSIAVTSFVLGFLFVLDDRRFIPPPNDTPFFTLPFCAQFSAAA